MLPIDLVHPRSGGPWRHSPWPVEEHGANGRLGRRATALGAATAFAVTLGAAAPADAMNACACGGAAAAPPTAPPHDGPGGTILGSDAPMGSPADAASAQPPPAHGPVPPPPSPAPTASPQPSPSPAPEPSRAPAREATPAPTPERQPTSAREQAPAPASEPQHAPAREQAPAPAPEPSPSPGPAPAPVPSAAPGPTAASAPQPAPPSTGVDRLLEDLTSAEPASPPPARSLDELLLPGGAPEEEPADPPEAKPPASGQRPPASPGQRPPASPEQRPPASTGSPPGAPERDARDGPPPARSGTPSWFDQYLNAITAPPVRPAPPPPALDDMNPTERDRALTGPIVGPLFSESEREGARRRLERPLEDGQARIDELQDEIDDLAADQPTGVDRLIGDLTSPEPASPPPARSLDELLLPRAEPAAKPQSEPSDDPAARDALIAKKQAELDDEQARLELYSGGHCDYACDLDAPFEPGDAADDPLDHAARNLGRGATRREVVEEARRLELEAASRRREEEDESSSTSGIHTGLDVAGFAGPVGPFADGANAILYATEGDWGGFGWSVVGAVPLFGDLAKGVKMGKKAVEAVDAVHDASRAADVASTAERATDPARLADDFIRDERLGGKLDDSPESRKALEDIFGRTSSGTRANASHPGLFNPSHTRGHSSELRTVVELSGRADVARITPVPSSTAGRTPDFVVTRTDGTKTRLEVTTLTGAGRGRQPRGIGSPGPPSADQIAAALRRKASAGSGRPTQFDAPLDGVAPGGTLAVHLRGGAGAGADAERAIGAARADLARSKVDAIEFYLPGGAVKRYVRTADGAYRPE